MRGDEYKRQGSPIEIIVGVAKKDADEFKKQLEAAGAEVMCVSADVT